jgi:hypothetical protein
VPAATRCEAWVVAIVVTAALPLEVLAVVPGVGVATRVVLVDAIIAAAFTVLITTFGAVAVTALLVEV